MWEQLTYQKNKMLAVQKRTNNKMYQPLENQVILVTELPKCDFCTQKAEYDGKTLSGPWTYMCKTHFKTEGIGLGLGKGQQLILDTSS